MHRVELKDVLGDAKLTYPSSVPNAPCGVESCYWQGSEFLQEVFLMHRVELKVCQVGKFYSFIINVPNAPCGVESRFRVYLRKVKRLFLMHRVELKAHHPLVFLSPHPLFLMHRVELKAFSKPDKFTFLVSVPNAPCGVESFSSQVQELAPSSFLKAFSKPDKFTFLVSVPNAPCGVERLDRVHKKGFAGFVPNAPCGVERPATHNHSSH